MNYFLNGGVKEKFLGWKRKSGNPRESKKLGEDGEAFHRNSEWGKDLQVQIL